MEQALSYFTDKPLAMEYINGIKIKYPRYTRDQLLVLLDTLTRGEVNCQNADNTLEFCMIDILKFQMIVRLFKD